MKKVIGLAALCAALVVPALAQDQSDVSGRLRQLEEQNRLILKRLQQSEARNVELQGEVGRLSDEQVNAKNADAIDAEVNRLSSYAAEGISWKDLTKSGTPIKFYGFVRLDGYYSTARMDNVLIPFYVQPEARGLAPGVAPPAGQALPNDDSFAFDARLTRIGIDINPGKVGSADVTGKIEMDFANYATSSTASTTVASSQVVESRATPRIRLAYIETKFDDFGMRFGQDWDVISPLYPSVQSESLMWNVGNLGDRRPMAEFWYGHGDPKDFAWNLKAALGLTGAINNQDLDAGAPAFAGAAERDGFDTGNPHLQARAGVNFGSWVQGKTAGIGVWGLIGTLDTDKAYGPVATARTHFTEWTVGTDVSLPLFGPVAVRGEGWVGAGLGDMRGNAGQFLNTTTGEVIGGWGGWGEFTVQATDAWTIAVGASMDNPRDNDLVSGSLSLGRAKNWSMYFGTKYDWGSGLKTGLEVVYWETQYLGTGIGNTVRFDMFVQLDF